MPGSRRRPRPRSRPASDYGRGAPALRERVQVEFVSANPTGPPNAATGRHAAYGDSLARILEFSGHEVEREYYVNDYGSQVRRFGESIQARARGEEPPEDGYRGDYVTELAAAIDGAAELDVEELARARRRADGRAHARDARALPREHGPLLLRARPCTRAGGVDRAIELLREHGHVYEHDGALWLRTTAFGDDKDRVLRRSERRGDVLRGRHRLPRGQARARLRPHDRRLGRRPPRLRAADEGGVGGARRRAATGSSC